MAAALWRAAGKPNNTGLERLFGRFRSGGLRSNTRIDTGARVGRIRACAASRQP
jgi:hypothetical protein